MGKLKDPLTFGLGKRLIDPILSPPEPEAPPPLPEPTSMPEPDDAKADQARRRRLAQQARSSGRSSTILSDTETLG